MIDPWVINGVLTGWLMGIIVCILTNEALNYVLYEEG